MKSFVISVTGFINNYQLENCFLMIEVGILDFLLLLYHCNTLCRIFLQYFLRESILTEIYLETKKRYYEMPEYDCT